MSRGRKYYVTTGSFLVMFSGLFIWADGYGTELTKCIVNSVTLPLAQLAAVSSTSRSTTYM